MKKGHGGSNAQEYFSELTKSEYASIEEIEEIQNRKLTKLIEEVYENVPFYRQAMLEKNVKPHDIKTVNDLHIFPIVTKKDIIENPQAFINKKYKMSDLNLIETGGSSGTPMQFYYGNNEISVRCAHIEWWKKIAGVKQFDRFVYIANDEYARRKANYKGRIMPEGYYFLTAFRFEDHMIKEYCKTIFKYKPVYLRGYASGVYLLADYFRRNNLFYPFKVVMTSSDTLFDYQRDLIEEVFKCPVFDFYHQSEDCVIACECEQHDGFHLVMESCYAEIVDENGNKVEDGKSGMILGTQLENLSMPLIRYDLTDIGEISKDPCPCGRNHYKIKNLYGRKDAFIVTPAGKKVSAATLSIPLKHLYKEIKEAQFIQTKIDEIIIKYIPTDTFSENSMTLLKKELSDKVSSEIKYKFLPVDKIEKTMRGKHRLVVSDL